MAAPVTYFVLENKKDDKLKNNKGCSSYFENKKMAAIETWFRFGKQRRRLLLLGLIIKMGKLANNNNNSNF
jgi:hypothetical protein